jgi:hypothetical protein
MAKYQAQRDTFVSHLGKIVKAGEVFETEFPKDMRLGDNLSLVKPEAEKPKARKADSEGRDLV